MKVFPSEMKQQMSERLLTQEGEWARLADNAFDFSWVMVVVPAEIQQQMIERVLTQEGEWERLIISQESFINIFQNSF